MNLEFTQKLAAAEDFARAGDEKGALRQMSELIVDPVVVTPSRRLEAVVNKVTELAKSGCFCTESLSEWSKELSKAVLDGNLSIFTALLAINQFVGAEEETVNVFYSLESKSPKLARRVFPFVWELLLARGRYDICVKLMPVDKTLDGLRWAMEMPTSEMLHQHNRKIVLTLVDALVKTGQHDVATHLVKEALVIDSDPAFAKELAMAQGES